MTIIIPETDSIGYGRDAAQIRELSTSNVVKTKN
jgi:hypothetical protein